MLGKELTAPGYEYDSGLRDQNAIVYLLKTQWAEHAKHVALVNSEYCLNCYWRDLLRDGDYSSSSDKASARFWWCPLQGWVGLCLFALCRDPVLACKLCVAAFGCVRCPACAKQHVQDGNHLQSLGGSCQGRCASIGSFSPGTGAGPMAYAA